MSERHPLPFDGLFKIEWEPTFRNPTTQRFIGILSLLCPIAAIFVVFLNPSWHIVGKSMLLLLGALGFLVLGLKWASDDTPGLLKGYRFTRHGISFGTLKLPDKESGSQLKEPIDWTEDEKVASDEALFVVNLTKVTHGSRREYILGRVFVLDKGGARLELVNDKTMHFGSPVAIGSNDLCVIQRGALIRLRYRSLEEQLDLVGEAMLSGGTKPSSCFIMASMNPDQKFYAGLTAGALGMLVAKGIDNARNAALDASAEAGVLVDRTFTESLLPVIEKYGWNIGNPIEG